MSRCVASDIDHALKRGGSPYTFLHVWRWVSIGIARLMILDRMHGGVIVWPDTRTAEITHVSGRWDPAEAEDLLSWAVAQACDMGAQSFELTGRQSWERFLKRRGINVRRRFQEQLEQQHLEQHISGPISAANAAAVDRAGFQLRQS